MRLLVLLLIVIVSFIGIIFLVHICSKNNYAIEYNSDKRKIKIYPAKQDKSYNTLRKGKA